MPSRPLRRQAAIIKHESRIRLWTHFVEGMKRDFAMLDMRIRNKEMTTEEYAMSLRVHYMYFQGMTNRYLAALSVEYSELENRSGEDYVTDDER